MGGLSFFKDNKNKSSETSETTETVDQSVETKPVEEEKKEEETKVSEATKSVRYMYIAVNRDGEVVLTPKGEPIFQTVEAEKKPEWFKDANMNGEVLISDTRLRVEVPPVPMGLSGNDKKRVNEEIKSNAREKLKELAATEIEAAKAKMTSQVSGNKKQEKMPGQKDSSPEIALDMEKKAEQKEVVVEQKGNNESARAGETKDEKKDCVSSADTERMIGAVEEIGAQINQDINDAVEDLLGTIAGNDKELVSEIKGAVLEQGRNLDGKTKIYIEKSMSTLEQKTQKAAEDISRKVNDTGRGISDSQDKILSKVNAVGKRMGDLVESVEGIEGNLTRLDQLDEIANLLRDKGLSISMEIPPVNADEEDIINLVRYSQKITEQLGYAARDLIRKQEAFKSQAESNENEQRIMSQKIESARQEGIAEGKMHVVKQLLSKYEDVDAIKDSAENYIHVIWTMLTELGVVIDGEGSYEKGKEIALSNEDIEKMMSIYSKFDGAGKYRVVRTGLSFQGEIISIAQFAKITEEAKNDENFQNKAEELRTESEAAGADKSEEKAEPVEEAETVGQDKAEEPKEEQQKPWF